MLRIGLTGGIASGKSAAAAVFAELGVPVIDSDVIAREVVAPGSPGLAAIRARFGEGVLQVDGQLDRRALRALVFADPEAQQRFVEGWAADPGARAALRAKVLDVHRPQGIFDTDHFVAALDDTLSARWAAQVEADRRASEGAGPSPA